MSRNEAHNVTGHVAGSMAPVMSQAVSNPLGVITAFVLLGLVAVLVAIVKALSDTVDSWGPYAVLFVMLGMLLAGHRWLWGPQMGARNARRLTLGILLGALVLSEAFLGLVGLAVGRVTGFNPRAAMMDAGFEVPDAVRAVIQNERRRVEVVAECKEALASGKMSNGRATSVNWAMNCRDHVPLEAQRSACSTLASTKANAVSYVNESFCGTIGAPLKSRKGAFPD